MTLLSSHRRTLPHWQISPLQKALGAVHPLIEPPDHDGADLQKQEGWFLQPSTTGISSSSLGSTRHFFRRLTCLRGTMSASKASTHEMTVSRRHRKCQTLRHVPWVIPIAYGGEYCTKKTLTSLNSNHRGKSGEGFWK